ncbi:MAG: phosphoglycerate kinase [Deltaproteobacteria bacterium]|nr:phosphoglycerate kinase [Deltaproteobacteria bacterium]MBW1952720.1 phosphoglycerate kinase [Deltaproteobacteria bacterium]MBW1986353.1 phosphoglycerate kinase [Deltaproteobacteria bacterium]MBW2133746.1 phosphoglycerate kinase [Deltaproteobacteria bacterium]
MKSIDEVDIRDKTLFIRVDFNVPLDRNRNITDDSRIRAVLPTINYCLDENAKVVLASHLGRPKNGPDENLSLAPVARRLSRLIHKRVKFAPDCIGPETQKIIKAMKPGDVVLLENLRFHPGEVKNDPEFARQLMENIDIYVNDAFAVAHRAHASVDAVTHYAPICVAGFLMRDEVHYFHKSMEDPARPLVALIGGAKISSKLTALINLLNHVDKLIVGGAMANTFLKAKGYHVGKSLVDDNLIDAAKKLMATALEKGVKFYLPVDCVVADAFDSRAETKITPVQEVPDEWVIADIGPATVTLFNEALQNAKTVVWNGPMGAFEIDAFSRGTQAMVHNVANSFALTIVGGGDTDVAIHKSGEIQKFSYISTGGGAFLELLEGKQLPGIVALQEWHKKHPDL